MAVSANPSIIAMIAEAMKSRGKIVAVADALDAKFLEESLAYRLTIPSNMVGVHPCNRDGYGLHDLSVHSLGSEIKSVGWSTAATAHACCVEDSSSKTIENFTMKLCNGSEALANVKEGEIQYGSLSCSHTNAFLNALKQGVVCDLESISEDGRMSLQKCCASDPNLRSALDKGLTWLVYKACVAEMYPEFLLLVQQARNSNLVRSENEIQLLLRIHDMAMAKSPLEGNVDWSSIARQVSTIGTVHDISALVMFVQRWSGGTGGYMLRELLDFHRAHVAPDRIIPSSTFAALANLKLSSSDTCPMFIIAVLKAQATCPDAKVIQKYCKYITQGDISAIGGKKLQEALKAERIMKQCRQICLDLSEPVPSKIFTKFSGKLDTLLVRYVFEKSKEFQNMESIACNFVSSIQSFVQSTIVSPWASYGAGASSSSGSTSSASAVGAFVQFDQDTCMPVNANKLVLMQQGFIAGRDVTSENGARTAKIVELHDNGDVTVDTNTIIAFEEFLSNWKVGKGTTPRLIDWQSVDCKTFAAIRKSNAISLALISAHTHYPDPKVEVSTKPKGVFALQFYKKGSLKLVPSTNKVVILEEGEDAGPGCISKGDVSLVPFFAKDHLICVPAWYMSSTSTTTEANMELKWTKAENTSTLNKVNIGLEFTIPIYINTSDIAHGDELLVFQPPKETVRSPKRKLGAVSIVSRKCAKSI